MDVFASRPGVEPRRPVLKSGAIEGVTTVKHAPAGMWSVDEAKVFVRRLQAEGRSVVVTNGVFDLLHPGHVRYLAAARQEGDALIVAINSDRSARANKGSGRPLVPDRERAEVLCALTMVDGVVIFDDDTPQALIAELAPDVLVKGADWPADQIVGRDVVEARGGRVVRIEVAEGYSTRFLVAKVQRSSTS